MDDVSIDTYIHKYNDFPVVMISVGLTSARPNYVDSQFLDQEDSLDNVLCLSLVQENCHVIGNRQLNVSLRQTN